MSIKRRFRRVFFIAVILIVIILILDNVAMSIYPVKYKNLVSKYSELYELDPYLVFSIIKVESSFIPDAVSSKNARGLMQITEKTGNWGAEQLKLTNYSSNELFEPETNIKIGCWYLSVLYNEFGSTDLVLAAYNGGSGNVSKWLKDTNFSQDGKSLSRIPFKETDKYVKKVKNCYEIYKRLYESRIK